MWCVQAPLCHSILPHFSNCSNEPDIRLPNRSDSYIMALTLYCGSQVFPNQSLRRLLSGACHNRLRFRFATASKYCSSLDAFAMFLNMLKMFSLNGRIPLDANVPMLALDENHKAIQSILERREIKVIVHKKSDSEIPFIEVFGFI